MKDQLKYTQEAMKMHGKPLVDMLARIEFNCPDKGLMVMDFTFKFETDAEYAGVDKDGFAVIVEKEEFIDFHAVDEPDEMDVAKAKQVADIFDLSVHGGFDDKGRFTLGGYIKFLQDRNCLEEIILPPKNGQ